MESFASFKERPLPQGLSHRAHLVLPGFLAVLGSTYPGVLFFIGAIAGVLVFFAACFWRCVRRRAGAFSPRTPLRVDGAASAIVLSSLLLGAGIARGFFWEDLSETAEWLAAAERPLNVTVVALERPLPAKAGEKLTFRALVQFGRDGRTRRMGVRAAAFPRDAARFVPGVPVRCSASFLMPSPAMNPGGFDERRYLLSDRVIALADIESADMERPRDMELPWDTERPDLERPLDLPLALLSAIRITATMRACLSQALDSTFPEQDAAVLKGVFLGDRSCMSPEDSRDFKRSGFYRFIAVSGFHIELFGALAEAFLRRLTGRPWFSRCVAVLAALSYASLSGWTAGAIRAAVSYSMRTLAPPLRRKYHALAGIGASASVAALVIPRPLSDPGFLLSFTAAGGSWLGGVYAEAGQRLLGERLGSFPSRSRVMMLLGGSLRALTVSCALFPIMALSFSEVSLVSFVLGGIWGAVAAFMTPAAAVLTMLPWAGAVLGWAPWIMLRGVRAVSRAASALPFAGMAVPAPVFAEIIACWALLCVPLTGGSILGRSRAGEDARTFFGRRRRAAALRRCVFAGASAVLLVAAAARVFAPWPVITFLYVGQGDCAVIRKGTSVMMVDTGTAAAFRRHVLPYLRYKGLRRVDLCVISHLHADHVGGLPELCSRISVKRIAVTPGFGGKTRDLVKSQSLLPDEGIPPVTELAPGREYSWAGTALRFILPEHNASGEVTRADCLAGEVTNESSLVFVMDPGAFEAEFWGDSPLPSVRWAFDTYPWLESAAKPRIVKVPHHGSPDALEPRLYRRFSRDFLSYAVVSVGPNSYGHPSYKVEQAAGEKGLLFRTDREGAFTVRQVFSRLYATSYVKDLCRRTGSAGRKHVRSH